MERSARGHLLVAVTGLLLLLAGCGGGGGGGGSTAAPPPSNMPRFAYVANSSSISVSAYTINATTGALTPIDADPLTAGIQNFQAGAQAFSVTVDPSGKFAYVANSAADEVSAYTINAISGALTPIDADPLTAGIQIPRGHPIRHRRPLGQVRLRGELLAPTMSRPSPSTPRPGRLRRSAPPWRRAHRSPDVRHRRPLRQVRLRGEWRLQQRLGLHHQRHDRGAHADRRGRDGGEIAVPDPLPSTPPASSPTWRMPPPTTSRPTPSTPRPGRSTPIGAAAGGGLNPTVPSPSPSTPRASSPTWRIAPPTKSRPTPSTPRPGRSRRSTPIRWRRAYRISRRDQNPTPSPSTPRASSPTWRIVHWLQRRLGLHHQRHDRGARADRRRSADGGHTEFPGGGRSRVRHHYQVRWDQQSGANPESDPRIISGAGFTFQPEKVNSAYLFRGFDNE